jgi:nitroreductase
MSFLTPSPDTFERILKLRAVRSYLLDPIEPDDIEAILEAGRWTGSSKNTQRWVFIVVEGREHLDRLAGAGSFTGPIKAAPLAIALASPPDGYEFDIGRVAQNMMLAAAARGVASCPITLHREAVARDVLEVPEDHRCRYAIAFGYPDPELLRRDEAATRSRGFGGRKPLDTVARRGSFSIAW